MTQNDTMKTPQEIAKERAGVMMAFAEGKKIRSRNYFTDEYRSENDPSWNWHLLHYEVEPEPPKAEVTPGEWYWCEATDKILTTKDIAGNIVCCPPEDWMDSFEHWPANRHLLAAAKDLRDAVECLLSRFPALAMAQNKDLLDFARKALAKAKGESHE